MMIPRGVEMDSGRAKLRLAIGATLFVLLLGGCGPEPKAPEPTANPHPHEFTKLKISVEPGSEVTSIRVESLWVVTNLDCAPHMDWPSGAPITKQVDIWEKVKKVSANDYSATIVDDRFIPGRCKWNNGGYGIYFMRDNVVLSTMVTGFDDIKQAGVLKLTCKSHEVPPFAPACFLRDQEAFFRARHYPIFNATVEIQK